jgi:hypothetical protein
MEARLDFGCAGDNNMPAERLAIFARAGLVTSVEEAMLEVSIERRLNQADSCSSAGSELSWYHIITLTRQRESVHFQ